MKVTRTSAFTGKVHTMELDITEDQVDDYNGTLVQKAFPNLTADEREFFMTGVTAKEWEDVFGKDE